MLDGSRTVNDVKTFLKPYIDVDPQQRMKLYDQWAEMYEQMAELGFRNFVGVDGSKGMLEQAAKTGLYQDLRLALLGTEPLPAQTDGFDVVMIVGALRDGYVPVSVVRELCYAARPGGHICMSRGESGPTYKVCLEKELQLMEDEGLWTRVISQEMDRYMMDVYNNLKDQHDDQYLYGTMYLYRKALK
ncbi:methyltransferase-like protein 27 isoform X2 [Perca flavescens]|uniref:methyltransferase-like protein 27 isoform X2 n=1 Tax=Perca flavescens TaxID=8167 RepID=UPI00106E10DB|nr:methyltransferase-like protein 27 isoform X2 [Perca flavescens]